MNTSRSYRIDGLSDGIFAVAMTVSGIRLFNSIDWNSYWFLEQAFLLDFIGFASTFIVLYIFWQIHNFLTTIFPKEINRSLVYKNAPFLFGLLLLPFTVTYLIEVKGEIFSIIFFSSNIIWLTFWSWYLFETILKSGNFDGSALDGEDDDELARSRIMIGLCGSILAILFAYFIDTGAAIAVYIQMALLALIPGLLKRVLKIEIPTL